MKIAFVLEAPSPHLFPLIEKLKGVGSSRVTVYCARSSFPDRNWGDSFGNLEWELVPKSRRRWLSGLFRADNSPMAPEVIVCGLSYWTTLANKLAHTARRRGVPFAFMAERPSPLTPRIVRVVRRPVLRRFLGEISALVGVTSRTVDIFRDEYGYDGPEIVCPYHRDLRAFSTVQLRESLRDPLTALIVGSLVRRKRVEDAIRAIARLERPVNLLVAGNGPEMSRLMGLASDLAPGRVEFVGSVGFQDVPQLFARAHMLLCPSADDGFGMSVIEALAAGVPVIASDGTMSAVEYIKPGYNGWLVPVGDVEGYADAVRRIAENRDGWSNLSQNARASLQDYNCDRNARRLCDFLKGLRAA